MRELSGADLGKVLEGPVSLVSCLSFEERSLSVVKALLPGGLRRWLCILNEDIETDVSAILEEAEAIAVEAGVEIEFLTASKRDPLLFVDALIGVTRGTALNGQDRWAADITTMTHEMLLILVAAADEIVEEWRDLMLVYNVASAYSGKDTPEDKWISRGIHEVRSVIGYPGA